MTMLDYQDIFASGSPIKAISQMPTMRPFVYAQIPASNDFGPGKTSNFVIDDARNPDTEKFQFVRSFQYSINTGPQVELVLFDAKGEIEPVLRNLYNTIQATKDLNANNAMCMNFQFGWSVPIVDPLTGTLVEGRISSHIHKAIITGIEISYTEGGIAYKITGSDPMTPLQSTIQKMRYPLIDIREAIIRLMSSNIHKPELAPPIFAEGYRGPENVTNRWAQNGLNPLTTIRNWLGQTLSRRGRPMRVYWSLSLNRLIIDDLDPTSSINTLAKEIEGPHDVNYWNQNSENGGTIVIKFDPKISGPQQMASATQIGLMESDERKPFQTLNAKEVGNMGEGGSNSQTGIYKAGRRGQGTEMRLPPRPPDDGVKTTKHARSLERRIGEEHRTNGSGVFFCSSAVLECIGWPRADVYQAINLRTLFLNVWDPYGEANGTTTDGFMTWESRGMNPYLSGAWLIRQCTHLIDDTGYRMNLDLSRGTNPDKPGISGPGGASPSGGGGTP
jgi:hypothetical protein